MANNNLSAWFQFRFRAFKISFQIPFSAGDSAGSSVLRWAPCCYLWGAANLLCCLYSLYFRTL